MNTQDVGQNIIMSQSSRFWDKVADKYAKKPVPDEAVYQQKLKISREYFRPDMDVLELGCGTGSTAIAHAPYVKSIRATDISPRMLEIAKSKVKAAQVQNVFFEQLEIKSMQLGEESVDAILGLSILHLLRNKEKAISEIFKALKPGGIFISSTGCVGDMMFLLKYLLPMGHFLRLIPFIDVFTADEFMHSLKSAGFKIEHQWLPAKGQSIFVVASKAE